MIPKTRVAVAVSPLPVPLSFAGNTSGEIAYKTPYMICKLIRLASASLKSLAELTLLAKAYLKANSPSVCRTPCTNDAREDVPAIPPQQRVRAA